MIFDFGQLVAGSGEQDIRQYEFRMTIMKETHSEKN
jgi:hypothetical protein